MILALIFFSACRNGVLSDSLTGIAGDVHNKRVQILLGQFLINLPVQARIRISVNFAGICRGHRNLGPCVEDRGVGDIRKPLGKLCTRGVNRPVLCLPSGKCINVGSILVLRRRFPFVNRRGPYRNPLFEKYFVPVFERCLIFVGAGMKHRNKVSVVSVIGRLIVSPIIRSVCSEPIIFVPIVTLCREAFINAELIILGVDSEVIVRNLFARLKHRGIKVVIRLFANSHGQTGEIIRFNQSRPILRIQVCLFIREVRQGTADAVFLLI